LRAGLDRGRAQSRPEIPGDVSIVGFDDFDWMSALSPYLTTVPQPVDYIASVA
jgi:LacI family transcriptional regulator